MEFFVVSRGNDKFDVTDSKNRKLYTISKKRFSKTLVLHDASDYALYDLTQTASGTKPSFRIMFEDSPHMVVTCNSIFLDPKLTCEGHGEKYEVRKTGDKDFHLYYKDTDMGTITAEKATGGVIQYHFCIDNKAFDDYVPLLAVCVDKAFFAR